MLGSYYRAVLSCFAFVYLSVTLRNAIYCGTFAMYGISSYTHDASNGCVAEAVSCSGYIGGVSLCVNRSV